MLQHKLGAINAGTFDVGCACASFPTGLAVAAGLIATNPSLRTVLVVGVYLMHKLAAPTDPMIFFYGDGAGAAVLEPAAEPGFVASAFQADGAYHAHWGIYAGAHLRAGDRRGGAGGPHHGAMHRALPAGDQPRGLAAAGAQAREPTARSRWRTSTSSIFTQVRKPSIELVMADLGLPMEPHPHGDGEVGLHRARRACRSPSTTRSSRARSGPATWWCFIGSGVGYNQAGAAFRMS